MSTYGESNKPMIYNVEREIATINQENDIVIEYFSRLKKLWEEHTCIAPHQTCNCPGKEVYKLMQFLMGLNENLDQVRDQIMLIDPLPKVEKAFSMVLRIERQRECKISLLSKQNH